MDFGEIFGVIIGSILAGVPPAIVFVGLPVYWGWLLGRHLRGH